MIHLDYRDARPIYTQIIDGFREQIAAGVLRQGDKLPSVRELAATLTINPNTIQRAYHELEMQGWIASVPGKGSFVCGIPSGPGPEQLALLEQLDKITESLLKLGSTRQALAQHILEGGNEHA